MLSIQEVGETLRLGRRRLMLTGVWVLVSRRWVWQVAKVVTPSPYVDKATGQVGPSGVGPLSLPLLLYSTLANAM